jgi:hypothetical protein
MESKCIPFGSSDNVPVVIHNETPVPRKQNAAFVREKRRRPIVRYEELSDFGDLVEDEYVPPVSNKNSTRKKRYVTTKKANTSTTSIITPTTTTSTTSAIVPTDRASSPTICRVIPPTIELAPTTTPSTPIPKTNASNDEDASNPKNVSSAKRTRGRARGAAAKKKTEDSSKEIDETELTDHLVPKSPEIEYDHEALRFLLQNQTSYLATAELKVW